MPEAYFRLFEIYKKIGINNQANAAKLSLESDFPDNYWTKLALKNNEKLH